MQDHHPRTTTTLASLEISGNTTVTFTREAFIGNTNNNDELIKLLCARLEKEGFSAIQCKGDANISIIISGIEFAEIGRNVIAVTEDTDLLILSGLKEKLRRKKVDSFIGMYVTCCCITLAIYQKEKFYYRTFGTLKCSSLGLC